MTQNPNEVTNMELHAYVDGQLTPAEREKVERYLEAHPEKAREVQDWIEQNKAIKMLHDPVTYGSIPEHLRPSSIKRKTQQTSANWRAIAASVVFVIVGATIGWFGRDFIGTEQTVMIPHIQHALNAHAIYVNEVRHPVEVKASENDTRHLVGWLSKKLDHPLVAPDLSSKGFRLIGGRLLPAGGKPAAQFMYEDSTGKRITLYITRNPNVKTTAFRFTSTPSSLAFYWLDAKLSYAVIGDVSREDLRRVAEEIYHKFI